MSGRGARSCMPTGVGVATESAQGWWLGWCGAAWSGGDGELPDDAVGAGRLPGLRAAAVVHARAAGRVEAVVPETADSVTLWIRPGLDWPGHRPGQYVRVEVDVGGVRHWRTYSLTSVPGRRDGRIAITVKIVPGGIVSTYLVRRAAPGLIVRLAPPAGSYVLPDPSPSRLLFVTGQRDHARDGDGARPRHPRRAAAGGARARRSGSRGRDLRHRAASAVPAPPRLRSA